MRLQISFPLGTFENTGLAFSFVLKHLNFNVKAIFSHKAFSSNDWITDVVETEESLAQYNDNGFTIHDGNDLDAYMFDSNINMVTFLRERNYQVEIITFDVKDEASIDLEALLLSAEKQKFSTAQKFNYEKARWQTEQIVSNFEVFQKNHEQRPKIVHPVWGASSGLTIDISNNPGRDIITFKMRLFAAPEMWFGPGAWEFFHMDDILSCSVLKEYRKVMVQTLYIKLFDADIDDYENAQILDLQRTFRNCSKMDDVEQLLNNKLPFKRYY